MRLSRQPVSSLFGAIIVAAATGCSDESVPPNPDDLLAEPGTCGAYEHEPCDVRLADCQSRLAEIAACQWGGPEAAVVLPPISVMTEDELRMRLTELSSDAEAPPSAFDDVFVMLGLSAAGDLGTEATVDRQVANMVAFYEFEARTITIVDRGDIGDLRSVNATLLHELVHALQNDRHDLLALQSKISPTFDSFTAIQNLFEGEASFHDSIFELAQEDLPLTTLVFDRVFNYVRAQNEMDIFAQPNPFFGARDLMPYIYGPAWAYAVWTTGGSAALQARYDERNVPRGSLDIMLANFGRLDASQDIEEFPMPNVFWDGATPPADDSEVVPVGTDRLGAFTAYALARINGEEAGAARDLGLGWRGDQLDVFELDAGGSAGRWTLMFDTEAHAISFENALSKNSAVSTRREGSTLVAVVSEAGAPPEWLFGSLQEF